MTVRHATVFLKETNMRPMISAVVVGMLIAGRLAAQPATQNLERTMESFLDLAAASFMLDSSSLRDLVPLGGKEIRTLKSGEGARVEFHLEADVHYGVVSVCLCDQLEVEMHDSGGLVLGPERTVSGVGDIALWVTPADSGTVAFDARSDDCSGGDDCAVGMQLFRVDP